MKNCTVTFHCSQSISKKFNEFAAKYGYTLVDSSVELSWPGSIALVNHVNTKFAKELERGELSISVFVSSSKKAASAAVTEDAEKKPGEKADDMDVDAWRKHIKKQQQWKEAVTPWREAIVMYGMIPDPNVAWEIGKLSVDETIHTTATIHNKKSE
jgi:hypothetical protein